MHNNINSGGHDFFCFPILNKLITGNVKLRFNYSYLQISIFSKSLPMIRKILIYIIIILFPATSSFSGNSDSFIFTSINSSKGLSDNQVRNITKLSDGRMIITTEGNLNIYDGETFRYIHRNDSDIISIDGYRGYYRIYNDNDSLMWIKDYGKLICLNLRQEEYIRSSEITERFGYEDITDFFIDFYGVKWVIKDNILISSDNRQVTLPEEPESVLQDIIVKEDNMMLLYSDSKMITKSISHDRLIKKVSLIYSSSNHQYGSTSNICQTENGFYQIKNGMSGILLYYDFNSGKSETLLQTDYWLNTLSIDKSDNLYICCRYGLWHIDSEKEKYTFISSLKMTDGRNIKGEISTMLIDDDGGFWLGTLNRGILYHHPDRFRLKYFSNHYFGSGDEDIYVFGFTRKDNHILIKTSNGLFSYSKEDGIIKKENNLSGFEDVMAELDRRSISDYHQRISFPASFTDNKGNVWTGTSDGLRFKGGSQDSEKTFHTENGIINNNIKSILQDKDDNIWVTTSHGISCITYDSAEDIFVTENYNRFDGALPEEYIEGSIYRDITGDLYFGGINGFNIFTPENKRNETSATPVFKTLKIHGQNIVEGEFYGDNSVLETVAAYTDSITLNHNQNFITLEFISPNYKNIAHTAYRYMMEGLDDEWRYVSSSGIQNNISLLFSTTYTSVPHGNYRFRISSSYRNGEWSPERELTITIKSPWWKTRVAIASYIISLITLTIFSLFSYTRYAKSKLQRIHNEELLLLRIRSLLDECDGYRRRLTIAETIDIVNSPKENDTESNEELNEEQHKFISKAVELVEKNINNPSYNVEQLSKDLCMDRTGLYKKLTTALDRTPSYFIRSIRLHKASQLILENEMTLSEISDAVGFSSLSYMGKCFNEEFGCRPSEYRSKIKS